jgi:hypothetical protein
MMVSGYLFRKRNHNIYPFLFKGIFCYHCKENTSNKITDFANDLTKETPNFKICVSCKRERSLSLILTNRYKKILKILHFINWSDKRIFYFSWIIWVLGASLTFSSFFSHFKYLSQIGMIIHVLQIWIMNKHFNSYYEQEENVIKKWDILKSI